MIQITSETFLQNTAVPKCCLQLQFTQKCKPCQICVRTWEEYHSFCEQTNYPFYVPDVDAGKWNLQLEEYLHSVPHHFDS